MKKMFCDGCGMEVKTNLNVMRFSCHNVEGDARSYITPEGEGVSGRTVPFDLCQKCFNRVESAAVAKLREIQGFIDATDSKAATKPSPDSEASLGTADGGKGGAALPKTQKGRPTSRGRTHRAD